MNDPYQKLLVEVGIMRRRMANADRFGPVTEVKGDKIRMQWGTDSDGKPCLSPWISTADHRGSNSEQHVYKVGQNVRMSSMNGDYSMATVTHWAPSDSAPGPDHAKEGAHTRQIGSLRKTDEDGTYEAHLENGEKGKIRMDKDGGITCRIGNDKAAYVHKDYVVIKHGGNTIHVDEKGCWASKPIEIKKAKDPDTK